MEKAILKNSRYTDKTHLETKKVSRHILLAGD